MSVLSTRKHSCDGEVSHSRECDAPRLGRAPLVVAIAALIINAFAFSASQLWVCPDTSYYAALAGGIADQLDFSSDLFLIRPPGYPVMLAVIFKLFGSASPTAILAVQHLMVVATAVIITLIAWHVTSNRIAACVAGLMSACSLQLLAFANVIITEVPYTLILTLSVYFLVKYHTQGRGRHLAYASLMAGLSYLFRPIGLSVVAVCVAAALHRSWTSRYRKNVSDGADVAKAFDRPTRAPSAIGFPRRALAGLALAILPALAIISPATLHNQLTHGGDLSSPCANLALYFRIFHMDQLDSANSASLSDIKRVVAEAIDRKALSPDADYRLWGPVWKAYERVRGDGLPVSARIMGDAAWDVIREHPGEIATQTVRYAFWMLMVPDSFYRFHAGGAAGTCRATGDCVRAEQAEIYDINTYLPMERHWIDPYEHYLPLQTSATTTTGPWRELARWFYRNVESGPPVFVLGDSPYEAFTWLCLLGALASLLMRNRTTWLLLSAVIAGQVLASAFLAGPTPRYAVPLKPLLLVFPSIFVLLPGALTRAFLRNRQPGDVAAGASLAR